MRRKQRLAARSGGAQGRSILLVCLLLMMTTAAGAVTVQGRLSSSSYLYESNPDDPIRQWDLVNRLGLSISGDAVSLHYLGTMRGEVMQESLGESRLRNYRGYLQIAPNGGAIKARLGRQWVYGGVGSSIMDGAWLRWKSGLGALSLFAGTRGFADREGDTLHGFDESKITGFHFLRPLFAGKMNLGASMAIIEEDGEEEARRLGFSVSATPMAKVQAFYEHRYDMAAQVNYYQHLRLSRRFGGGDLIRVAFNRRENYLPESHSSWFYDTFGDRDWFTESLAQNTREVRATLIHPCRLISGLKWRLQFTRIAPEEGDGGNGFDVGFTRGGLTLGYRGQSGLNGERDGFHARYRRDLGRVGRAVIDLNRFAYLYGNADHGTDAVTEDTVLASRLGIERELFGKLDMYLALEALQNPIADYEIRFLGRVSYAFGAGN